MSHYLVLYCYPAHLMPEWRTVDGLCLDIRRSHPVWVRGLKLRRDNESGIVDALVELYTLAHTSKIYGSLASSYSSLAAELYSIKLEILSLV